MTPEERDRLAKAEQAIVDMFHREYFVTNPARNAQLTEDPAL